MIKLEVEDYCQDCPEFEPAYSHIRYLSTGKCDTFVECEHRIKCYGIAKSMARKEDHGQSGKETQT